MAASRMAAARLPCGGAPADFAEEEALIVPAKRTPRSPCRERAAAMPSTRRDGAPARASSEEEADEPHEEADDCAPPSAAVNDEKLLRAVVVEKEAAVRAAAAGADAADGAEAAATPRARRSIVEGVIGALGRAAWGKVVEGASGISQSRHISPSLLSLKMLSRAARRLATVRPSASALLKASSSAAVAARASTASAARMASTVPMRGMAPAAAASAVGSRTESDTMGKIQVPNDVYWGAQTQRSLDNFKIGGPAARMPIEIIRGASWVYFSSVTSRAHAPRASR
jgi:hypothetical protein